jgi:hypothetical protein
MANNEQNKSIGISTIPIGKLAVVMNNFISNTINHLNKLSVKGDEKLAEFDKKLDDLEIMTTLLEAKLNSLPEKITSTYPPLEDCDVNPVINPFQQQSSNSNIQVVNGSGSSIPPPPPPPPMPGENQNQQSNLDQNTNNNLETEDEKEEEQQNTEGGENLSPAEDLDKFLKDNENYKNLYTMLKLGVPVAGVEQKAKMNGFNMDKLHELIEKVRKVKPSIG